MAAPKNPKPKTYAISVDGVEIIQDESEDFIIALCKERTRITVKALCRECGFWSGSSYIPIKKFPQFAPYVSNYSIEEAESSPHPNAECYLSKDGQQSGPFAPAQIRSMWNAGSITSDTLFYHKDLGEWKPVKKFCQNDKWQFSSSSESQLLKQVVEEQQKATSHLGVLRWAFVIVFVIPLIFYQCSKH
jgi:hypothetical protein